MKKLLLLVLLGAALTGCGEKLDRRHPISSGTTAYKLAVSETKYSVEELESYIIYMKTYREVKMQENSKWSDSEDQYHWSRALRVFENSLKNRKEGK